VQRTDADFRSHAMRDIYAHLRFLKTWNFF
jgi:hypothetical protein